MLLSSCVEATLDYPDQTDGLLKVQIPTKEIEIQGINTTRAGEVTYARAIVLQYDSKGALINTGYTDIDKYVVGSTISTRLLTAASCNIYVLAINETKTSGSDAAFATEATLKTATYDLYTQFPNATDADVPLVGMLSGADVTEIKKGEGLIKSPTQKNTFISLSRIAAKLVLKLYYNLSGFQIAEGSAQLMNVPKTFHLMEQATEPKDAVYPPETTSLYGSVPVDIDSKTADGDNTTASTDFARYIPMNRRGINVAIKEPKDKWSGNAPKTTTDCCTFLTFRAQEKKNTKHLITYCFYFGDNNTSNFNILRNHVYTMNSTILQRGEGDNRIIEGGLPPTIETNPAATAVSETTATLQGQVTEKYQAAITEYGFYYKAGIPFANNTEGTKVSAGTNNIELNTPFSKTLTNLNRTTLYYFRAYATSTNGTTYGTPYFFSTNAAGLPVLTTESNPTSTANGLGATSTGNSVTGLSIVNQGIVWSADKGFNHQTQGTRVDGNPLTTSPYTVTLSGLTKGTTYYYRHYASNTSGYVYSAAEKSFRTKDTPAMPTSGTVGSIVVNALTFNATLPAKKENVDDLPTAAGAHLWTTYPGTNLSSPSVTVKFSEPSKTGAQSVSWSDMVAGQTYWYAFFSTNPVGTEHTAVNTFTASASLSSPANTATGPQAANNVLSTTTGRKTNATVNGGGATVASGNGTTTKTFNITANTETIERTTSVTYTTLSLELPLRSATNTIMQSGVKASCTQGDITGVAKGGQSATNVSVTANIPWIATSTQSWCTIQNGSQTGTNTQVGQALNFNYTVANNTRGTRTATITINGRNEATLGNFSGTAIKTFTVTQEPAAPANTVEIDGLFWATGDLAWNGENNVTIGRPGSELFFRWGSLVGYDSYTKNNMMWSKYSCVRPIGYTKESAFTEAPCIRDKLTMPTPDAGTSVPDGLGDPCRYYLGSPWRLPTKKEMETLIAIEGTRWSDYPTGFYIGNPSVLFFPAVGWRYDRYGDIMGKGEGGRFWTSTAESADLPAQLHFAAYGFGVGIYSASYGGSAVRCVHPSVY